MATKEALTKWGPIKGAFLWRLERLAWTNWAGSAYEWHKHPNGTPVRFWTRKAAQEKADALNTEQTP